MDLDLSDLLGQAKEQGLLTKSRRGTMDTGRKRPQTDSERLEKQQLYRRVAATAGPHDWTPQAIEIPVLRTTCTTCGNSTASPRMPMVRFVDMNIAPDQRTAAAVWHTNHPPAPVPDDLPRELAYEDISVPMCGCCMSYANFKMPVDPDAIYPKRSKQQALEKAARRKVEQAELDATPATSDELDAFEFDSATRPQE